MDRTTRRYNPKLFLTLMETKTLLHWGDLVYYTTENVTPELAAKWMSKNTRNRSVRMRHVNYLADTIKAGEWRLNGESIKFDINGNMVDGQHRVLAVIKTGIAIMSLVVRGMPTSVAGTIDEGCKRTLTDHLAWQGKQFPVLLASCAKWVWLLTNTAAGDWPRSNKVFRKPVLDAVICDHPNLDGAIDIIRRAKNAKLMPTGIMAAVYYLCRSTDECLADKFWLGVASGALIEKPMPEMALRNALLSNSASQKKLPMANLVALSIKAWNARVQDRSISKLFITRLGAFPEFA